MGVGSERSCLGSPVRWYQTGLFHHWPPMDQGEEPVKLYEGSKERQHFRDLGDLFAVITAIDKLDHSYTRGAISAAEYTPACATLRKVPRRLRVHGRVQAGLPDGSEADHNRCS